MNEQSQDHLIDHREAHVAGADYLKAAIVGAFDGILTALGVTVSAYALGFNSRTVFIFGISAHFANSFGMGMASAFLAWSQQQRRTNIQKRIS